MEMYLPEIPYGYTRCNYDCSDHASWTEEGFPANLIDECEMSLYYHSPRDIVDYVVDFKPPFRYTRGLPVFVKKTRKSPKLMNLLTCQLNLVCAWLIRIFLAFPIIDCHFFPMTDCKKSGKQLHKY